MSGYIAVDLDGTLAHYDPSDPEKLSKVGKPISRMLQRVRMWLREHKEVRIMTARVFDDPDGYQENLIQDWTETHLGMRLIVQCHKDYNMIELWDDRAVSVVNNSGGFARATAAGVEMEGTVEVTVSDKGNVSTDNRGGDEQ